jgi:hypothetical protein
MAELLTLLIEVERRELCEQLGYPSLFAYCMRVLGLSEQAAYSRITAARAVRRFPAMLPMLGDGALTLIRFRGHFPKGGYDVQNGIKQDRTARTATIHG